MVLSTIVTFLKFSAMKALLTYWRQEYLLVFATFFFRNVENLVQEMKTELYVVIVGFAKIDAVRDIICFCFVDSASYYISIVKPT
jgi:hypothetical protein